MFGLKKSMSMRRMKPQNKRLLDTNLSNLTNFLIFFESYKKLVKLGKLDSRNLLFWTLTSFNTSAND